LLAANHSAKPLRFFTLSKRAILQRANQQFHLMHQLHVRLCHSANSIPWHDELAKPS